MVTDLSTLLTLKNCEEDILEASHMFMYTLTKCYHDDPLPTLLFLQKRAIMLFNGNLPICCHKTSLRAFISWNVGMALCIFNRGFNIEDRNVGRYPGKRIIALSNQSCLT